MDGSKWLDTLHHDATTSRSETFEQSFDLRQSTIVEKSTSNSEQSSQDKDKVVQEVTNVTVEKGAPAVPVPPAPSVSAPR